MNGIIPLYKPKGMTSHDCVAKIRRIIREKKVGHTGTLDPNVTGVLPICVGEATKIIPFIQDLRKEYIATVTLGIATTTEDMDGIPVEEVPMVTIPPAIEVDNVLKKFMGELTQIPPMYSAVKVRGKKLYEYARAGIAVERPKRQVTIFQIEQMKKEDHLPGHIAFRAVCSKGTYIRTLCVDIGKELGYPAHMSHLIRTESDGIKMEHTVTLQDVAAYMEQGRLHEKLLPISEGLSHLPSYQADASLKQKVLYGQKLPFSKGMINSGPFKIMHENDLLAIYDIHPNDSNMVKPVRVFNLNKSAGEK